MTSQIGLLLAIVGLTFPYEILAQSLSMDSCKYFAELVNEARAKRLKKKLIYQESSQQIINKSAEQLTILYKHRVTERQCSEVICYDHVFMDNFKRLMMSPRHRRILMGRAKNICVGIFKKDGEYYVCARTYSELADL